MRPESTECVYSIIVYLVGWLFFFCVFIISINIIITVSDIIIVSGGRNSSVGSAWARCPQRRGFDPPLGTFSGRGNFSLGFNMGSNSIPPKLFRMRV